MDLFKALCGKGVGPGGIHCPCCFPQRQHKKAMLKQHRAARRELKRMIRKEIEKLSISGELPS